MTVFPEITWIGEDTMFSHQGLGFGHSPLPMMCSACNVAGPLGLLFC